MASDRWSEIERIFHAALERPVEARAAFVKEACNQDAGLEREVLSLLDQSSQTGFLEEPALQVAASLAAESTAVNMAGQRIGVYQVRSLLGKGGMGEVYRARDTRLDRDVAIKVLPHGFTSNPDRLARFEREARVLASLNHPHIGMIHGLEESSGIRALVLELVEGETLADRIARGPIPLRQALTWARQIADALDAAHEKGIVHRDLKPANVKITPNDVVKVLDFGLARTYTDSDPGDLTRSPTITSDGGTILGTAAYMSPEQARGQAVGKRADIWAFGCVLYEMLTGRLAFPGATVSDTLAAVLHHDPDWTAVPAAAPASIVTLLQRCLEKDVKQRRRDIGDVRAELDDALARPVSGVIRSSVGAPVADRPAFGRWGWAATGFVAGAALLAVLPTVARFFESVSPPRELSIRRIADSNDVEEWPAVSPDGKEVAFVRAVNGRRQIWWRREGGGGSPQQITTDDKDHLYPRWLPDSTTIVYFTPPSSEGDSGSIMTIPIGANQPRFVAAAMTGADVSKDNRIAAFQKTPDGVTLSILDLDGTSIATIRMKVAIEYLTPRWAPDGRSIAYVAVEGTQAEHGIYVTDVDSAPPERPIIQALRIAGISWLPDGSGVVYASSARSTLSYPPIFQLRIVLRDGADRQLISGEVSYVHPDIRSGTVLTTRIRMRSDIWEFPVAGGNGRQITFQGSQVQTPSVSPDGKEIVYLSDSLGHSNLWIARIDGSGEPRQLTYESAPDVHIGIPVWSPTSSLIAFVKLGGNAPSEWIVDSRSRENPRLLVQGATSAAWSGDGEWLFYQKVSGPVSDIYKVRVDRTSGEVLVRRDASIPAVSRDGTVLYYTPGGPQNPNDIFKASLLTGAGGQLARYDPARMPLWPTGISLSPNGKWLAVPLKDGGTTNLWLISTDTGEFRQVTEFGRRPILIARQVAWSPDNLRLYASVLENHADVVSLEGLETTVRSSR
jgi:serine/threonine protein kinase/Tol biopolymer transport system component